RTPLTLANRSVKLVDRSTVLRGLLTRASFPGVYAASRLEGSARDMASSNAGGSRQQVRGARLEHGGDRHALDQAEVAERAWGDRGHERKPAVDDDAGARVGHRDPGDGPAENVARARAAPLLGRQGQRDVLGSDG